MKIQKRYLYAVSIFCFLIFFLNSCTIIQPKNPYISQNTGNPMEPTRQVSRVYPVKRDSNRYLDSNKKKKKRWTKTYQISGSDCPWDKSFKSSAEKKVQRKLNKTKAKLKRQTR